MGFDKLGFEIPIPLDPEAAVERVSEALKAEGFGVLTRIDVRETFRQKLGARFRPYFILGACNPALAQRALLHRADVGLVLPCNVTVEEVVPGRTMVRIADPEAFMSLGTMAADPIMRDVADEARTRLQRVAQALEAAAPATAGRS
jgi:uncharacterized protein (DUF302 family)